jgi:3-methyladenine DNA glycosylase AlkD
VKAVRRTEAERLQAKLRTELRRVADREKAAGAQAYMKSEMPYYGITAPVQRRIFREHFADVSFPSAAAWGDAVLYIWRNAKFREERYFAISFCAFKNARSFQTPDALPMYEEMIVTGAWWDLVDGLHHIVGGLLKRFPKEIGKEMRAWSRSDNMWKRRMSIICQLSFKKDTDLRLLYACIAPSLDSREFFLRKAIGWALRQYAWTDPDEIRRYVSQNESRLSPLSKREALKNL